MNKCPMFFLFFFFSAFTLKQICTHVPVPAHLSSQKVLGLSIYKHRLIFFLACMCSVAIPGPQRERVIVVI